VYHRVLSDLLERGVESVSSQELADLSGSNPAKLRKDLSHLGSFGTRGVGYSVEYLHFHISRELGIARELPVVIVGAGNLGQALVGYTAAMGRGVVVLGIFDTDRSVIGTKVAGHTVKDLSGLARTLKGKDSVVGVIATPAEAAQAVADRLVSGGVCGLLNFAPGVLSVPADVEVRSIDVGLELRVLAFHSHHRGSGAEVSRRSDADVLTAATHEEIA
jgi:redox-sensing transcriptional repressor